MKKTALLASAVVLIAMLVTGGVAYGRASSAHLGLQVPFHAPAESDSLPAATTLKKACLTRACAWVGPDGSLLPGFSHKGVISVTHLGDGEYCVELVSTVPAATATPVVTPDFSSTSHYYVFMSVFSQAPTCGHNGVLIVSYYTRSNGVGLEDAFADQGFTLAVP